MYSLYYSQVSTVTVIEIKSKTFTEVVQVTEYC